MGEQNEMLQQFVAWIAEKTGSDPQTVVQQIQQMSQSEEGQAQLQQLVQQFQQETSGQTGVFKKGGKVDCLVQKRKKIKCAKNGASDIEQDDKKKKTTDTKTSNNTKYSTEVNDFGLGPEYTTDDNWDPSIGGQKYVEQTYYGPDVTVTTAPTRRMLPSNMWADPTSPVNTFWKEVDFPIDPWYRLSATKDGIESIDGPGDGPLRNQLHGADSVAALNKIQQLLKRANIKPGFPIQNAADVRK